MGLSQRLEIRQGQALVMTPQLLQAIKLLQLSHLDLAAYVDGELERNPLLERADGDTPEAGGDGREAEGFEGEDGDGDTFEPELSLNQPLEATREAIEGQLDTSLDNVFPDEIRVPESRVAEADAVPILPGLGGTSGGGFDGEGLDLETSLTGEINLHDHLAAQLDLATRDPRERFIGRHIVDAIDEAGYLAEPVEAIAERLGATVEDVERALALVQTFDPTGVGARNLAECLALQLHERDRLDPAMQVLLTRLDLVARREIAALRRLCDVDDEDVVDMIAELRRLEPKPGRAFGGGAAEVLIPDVFVRAAPDGSWIIDLNPETLPRVLINQTYHARVSRAARTEAEKAFVADCLQTANWLTRSLDQRAKTILKVASEIVRQQDGFFAHGVAFLRPLNLKTIADAIGMHESTVSRVTSNKSIGTSRGTFEMKYFFTASIPGTAGANSHSSEAVRHRIKQMIDGEGIAILSDDALVQKLKGEGIDIARRTVAKYRESLRIPSSVERRREKAALAR